MAICSLCGASVPKHHPECISLPSRVRQDVTEEMVTAAMRAFEPMSSVLRYREKDKWHACDVMGMRDAIRAAFAVAHRS